MDRQQAALLIAGVGLIGVASLFFMGAADVLSPASMTNSDTGGEQEEFNGTVTRELADSVSAGEPVLVTLWFDLPRTMEIDVVEQTSGATSFQRNLSVSDVKGGKIFYQVPVPENATGTLEFSGTVPEYGLDVQGDDTVQITK